MNLQMYYVSKKWRHYLFIQDKQDKINKGEHVQRMQPPTTFKNWKHWKACVKIPILKQEDD